MAKNLEALARNESGVTNTGPVDYFTCTEGPIAVGKYCKAEGGSACTDIPCMRDDKPDIIWAR